MASPQESSAVAESRRAGCGAVGCDMAVRMPACEESGGRLRSGMLSHAWSSRVVVVFLYVTARPHPRRSRQTPRVRHTPSLDESRQPSPLPRSADSARARERPPPTLGSMHVDQRARGLRRRPPAPFPDPRRGPGPGLLHGPRSQGPRVPTSRRKNFHLLLLTEQQGNETHPSRIAWQLQSNFKSRG